MKTVRANVEDNLAEMTRRQKTHTRTAARRGFPIHSVAHELCIRHFSSRNLHVLPRHLASEFDSVIALTKFIFSSVAVDLDLSLSTTCCLCKLDQTEMKQG